MSDLDLISLTFLKRQPKAAAELLRDFSPQQCADYLIEVPVEHLTPVIHQMASWPAARVVSLLPEPLIAEILRALPYADSETLLRLMTQELRDAVLKELPSSLAKSISRKLVYPLSTVGAWMDANVPFFTPDNSVDDCLELVKSQQSRLASVLVVVDYARHLVGLVEVEKLLTSDGQLLLSELIDTKVEPLTTRATLWEVKENDGWISFPTLPVVGRNNILLGVLSHSAMQKGLAKPQGSSHQNLKFSMVAHMGRSFLVVLVGLLEVISGVSGYDLGKRTTLAPEQKGFGND